MKKFRIFLFVIFASFFAWGVVTSQNVDAQQVCDYSCGSGAGCCCPSSTCSQIISCSPFQCACQQPTQCPDGSQTCGSCSSNPGNPPPGDPPPSTCGCFDWNPGECGAAGGCAEGYRSRTRQCDPSGCASESECAYDPTCPPPSNPNPPGACTPSAPSAATAQSPSGNQIVGASTNFNLDYTGTQDLWGVGCPVTHKIVRVMVSEGCTGSYVDYCAKPGVTCEVGTGSNRSARIEYPTALKWGKQYCWYVQKDNGSMSVNSNVATFKMNTPPLISSYQYTHPAVCGNSAFGKYNPGVTENPIEFTMSFSDPDNDPLLGAMIAFVPASSSLNGDIVHAWTASEVVWNASSASFRIDNEYGARVAVPPEQLGWTDFFRYPGVTSGNLLNDQQTAQLLNIGVDSKITTSGGVMTAKFKIRFEDTFPAGQYNVYIAASSWTNWSWQLSSDAIDYPSEVYKKIGTVTIDTQAPTALIVGPTFDAGGSFTINWQPSDPQTPLNQLGIYSYVNSEIVGTALRDSTIPLDITNLNNGLGYPMPSNAGINAGNVGNHVYTEIGEASDDYSFTLAVKDAACNVNQTTVKILFPYPWMMAYQGNASGNGGYKNIKVPDLSTFTAPFTSDNSTPPYMTTFSVLSGGSGIPSTRGSKTGIYNIDYHNDATRPIFKSGYTSWYDHINNQVTKNNKSTIVDIASSTSVSGQISNLNMPANQKYMVRVNGDLTISGNTVCNRQALILVTGNLVLNPDFTRSGTSACMFVVKGNITIQNGTQKTDVPKGSETLANYDIVEGFFLTEGTFITQTDIPSSDKKGDGLYIKGGVVANALDLRRDLNYYANLKQPAFMITEDARYNVTFRDDVDYRYYSIEEVGVIQP